MVKKDVTRLVAATALAAGLSWGPHAMAEEVAEGTLLNAATIDGLLDKTLEGTPIRDVLVGQQEKMIREYGWQMKLVKAKPVNVTTGVVELTEQYKGQASLDANKRLVNYTTGVPFPDIDVADPDAGYKLAYNILRFGWLGDAMNLQPLNFLIIDGKKGLEKEQGWVYRRYLMSGRMSAPHVEDESIAKYEALINVYPNDTRGLGLLTVNYADGRLPDVYAYVKSLRRVRRLSSGAWADPVQGTDLLFDDTFGLNLDPTWYDNWKVLGKRRALVVDHSVLPALDESASGQAKYPFMRLDEPPYWNFVEDNYEIQDVYELEGTPKSNHLVSRRHMFVGATMGAPKMYWQDHYDRKGQHWHTEFISYKDWKWDDGRTGPTVTGVVIADVQRLHATAFGYSSGFHHNPPDARAADYAPEALPRMLQ
ncbi:DUF1329 domain-containing protein [Immundisolibacter sp.]|uniref:DUF1329 domain-containing protein n=1 Tax=Immundisolibacter sp. TaxID=1934948 RepID=UPI000EC3C20F|nr:hypothetical protein [Gammaproteobacteria bacterium]